MENLKNFCLKCKKENGIAKLGTIDKYFLDCFKEIAELCGEDPESGQIVKELPNGSIIKMTGNDN